MTRRLVSGVVAGALAAAFAGSVAAQPKADPKGYVAGSPRCDPTQLRVRAARQPARPTTTSCGAASTTARSACPATSAIAPATGRRPMAIAACDPGPRAEAAAAPAPAPAAAPAPPAARACSGARACAGTGVQKITLASKALFDFDKAVLSPEGKAAIDSEIISKLNGVQKLELVLVTGHTDRIGTQQYNQRLSERRADAVRDYLVSKGVPRDKIETLGMGKTQPVPGVVCNQKALKELIACLAPNRRVEVEVKGEGTVSR